MSDVWELVAALDAAAAAGRRAAVATIIAIRGASYRDVGARALVTEDGTVTGMISGGCGETELSAVACKAMDIGIPLLHRFELSEDAIRGLGIGCGGTVDVWIEPVLDCAVSSAWFSALRDGRPAVQVTLLDDPHPPPHPEARRLVVGPGTQALGTLGSQDLDLWASVAAQHVLDDRLPRSEIRQAAFPNGSAHTLFFDVSVPPNNLVVFGAGSDAIPLAAMAQRLGMNVTVMDPRPAFATRARFPGAVILVSHPDRLVSRVCLNRQSFVVIMNHNLERDQACLKLALESSAAYIGLLGPRTRLERIWAQLRLEGALRDLELNRQIHSPVGLDIGAESPAEVALSILGEIVAARNGHTGASLGDRSGPIHRRGACERGARIGRVPATSAPT